MSIGGSGGGRRQSHRKPSKQMPETDHLKVPVNCPHCGQMCPPRAPEAVPGFYPASRRRWLHISHFRPKGRKIAHFAAPPLPTEPASLGFGGIPVVLVTSPERGLNRPKSPRWGGTPPSPTESHTAACAGQTRGVWDGGLSLPSARATGCRTLRAWASEWFIFRFMRSGHPGWR